MQGRGRGNVAAERLCGALFVGLTTLKGYFYINLGGTHLEIFRAAADGEKIHTYLQSFQQQQSISGEEPQTDKSEIIKEYDRLVDGPAARRELEKQNPGLAAARDQTIVELRREKLQKETAEKPHRVARVRR